GEQTLKQIRELEIKTECDAGEKFQYRHFRTEPVPNGAKLQTYRARADHNELLWSFGEGKRFGAAHDGLAVKLCEGQLHRRAAGSDDNIFCLDLLRVALGRFDGNFPRGG